MPKKIVERNQAWGNRSGEAGPDAGAVIGPAYRSPRFGSLIRHTCSSNVVRATPRVGKALATIVEGL